ncbi:DUF5829 family protein [Parasphingorhabdus sp.]|uniref:DUF5829 family protein n=1 Tax=Parasphingorhabdus sp. TaxID=2709688 RepID=UPI0032EB1DA0
MNHVFLIVDTGTYESIIQSGFLRSEFAPSEARTTIRRDYPDGYTGVYFYGNETYLEFLKAEGGPFPLGSFGIATGYETEGEIDRIKRQLEKTTDPATVEVDRERQGKPVKWFTALTVPSYPDCEGPHLWGMEYARSFVGDWLGDHNTELAGSICQKDVLTAYAQELGIKPLSDNALLKDIVSIEAVADAEQSESISSQLKSLGWRQQSGENCRMLESNTTTISLRPARDGASGGISKIGFSLSKNAGSERKMRFGSSKLVISGTSAEWYFDTSV